MLGDVVGGSVVVQTFYNRRGPKSPNAVNNHPRLRAWEDGEKPSPTRDCKAETFSALATVFGEESVFDSKAGMGRPRRCFEFVEKLQRKRNQPAKPGDRRSFNLNT